jgi:competence protein ComGC
MSRKGMNLLVARTTTRTFLILAISLAVVLLLLSSLFVSFSSTSSTTTTASQSSFQSANSEILSAYAQIYNIEHNGGNASDLVSEINVAISFYNRAVDENSTNPSQAAQDLQNATEIASSVQSQAIPLAEKAESQRTLQTVAEIGGSVVVIIVAVLVYIFGGRIYDWIWLYQRRDYSILVKRRGNRESG